MSRLREVQIWSWFEDESLPLVNRRVGAVTDALDVGLSIERIEAPFTKLVVRLYPTQPVERHGFVVLGIAHTDLRDDLRDYGFDTAPSAEVRARAASLLNRGVDVLRDTVGWDSEPFRAMIARVTAVVGPWRASFRDAPFERATRTRYHTVIEWDEDAYAVRLEQRDRAGTVLRTWPVTETRNAFMWVTKTRLVDGRVEFVDDLGHVALSVDVGRPGEAIRR